MISVGAAMLAIAVIPFGPKIEIFGITTYMQLGDINIGLLFVLAASSIGVYGIALAGWSSNNKYALLGSLRASAQMVSYELPMAITLAAPLLLVNSLSFREIVDGQGGFYFGFFPRWAVFQWPFPQVFAFIMYLIAAFAETNRIPFDLPEAENELVAGYHVEYSSMNFASFFMAEYANMVTVSLVATLVFLGGWHPPFPAECGSKYVPSLVLLAASALLFFHSTQTAKRKWDRFSFPVFGFLFLALAGLFLIPLLQVVLVPVFWFAAKAGIILFLFIWVRGTLPRFRYDQLMRFAWVFLFPAAMLNMLATGLMVALFSK
jgi:NADH-quinone oxidoreductase subunit H